MDRLSVIEASELLDVSPRSVYDLVERGELAGVRVGRALLFDADEVRRCRRSLSGARPPSLGARAD